MKKKKPNGEGSIYKRKSTGKWFAAITMKGLDGKLVTKTRRAKSQRHAQIVLREMQSKEAVINPSARTLTIGKFLNSWLNTHVATTKAKSTHQSYKIVTDKYIAPMLGKINITDINALHVTEWVHAMETAGTGRQTMRRCFAVLSSCMSHAVRLSLVASNPCSPVDRPKVKEKEIIPFSEDEVRVILNYQKTKRLYALYVLAFSTGMRQGEIFGLRVEDVDIRHKLIRVSRSSSEASGQHLKETKTSAGKRTVPLTDTALNAVQSRIQAASEEGTLKSGYLFTSQRGTILRQSNFRNRHWKPLLERLMINYRGFHHARHTAATEMLRRGVQIKVVSTILGHGNIETTLRIYSHWIPDDLSQAASAMDTFGG